MDPDRHDEDHQSHHQMDVLDLRAHQPVDHKHVQDLRQLAAPHRTQCGGRRWSLNAQTLPGFEAGVRN